MVAAIGRIWPLIEDLHLLLRLQMSVFGRLGRACIRKRPVKSISVRPNSVLAQSWVTSKVLAKEHVLSRRP